MYIYILIESDSNRIDRTKEYRIKRLKDSMSMFDVEIVRNEMKFLIDMGSTCRKIRGILRRVSNITHRCTDAQRLNESNFEKLDRRKISPI